MNILALDIGGSSIKHGFVNVSKSSVELKENQTAQLETNKFPELRSIVFNIIEKSINSSSFGGDIAICTTGSVDINETVVSAGHFEGYKNIMWAEILQSAFPEVKNVTVMNDGRAAAWAEYMSNDVKPDCHIHVVVGTGVGGGIIYKDDLVLGDSGQAGYIGHMKVTSEKTIQCSCKKYGCVETIASTRGIEYEMNNSTKENTQFSEIINLAKEKDKNAIEILKNGGYWLGIGIANCMNLLNPSIVTVGGGVLQASETLKPFWDGENIYFNSIIEGVKYGAHRRVFSSGEIKLGKYGNDSGMIGAALMVFKKKINK